MKEEIQRLIEDYIRRAKSAFALREDALDVDAYRRLTTKIGCYRQFIVDLEFIKNHAQ